jgi:cytoskeletal protein CcmA (bactofilin family)
MRHALRGLKVRLQSEQGFALITAMLLSMVVVTLGATSVSLAIHNSEQSANDRRRVQSIAAAEAGVNFFFSHLQSSGTEDFECSFSRTLTSTPPAGFDATVTFYTSTGSQIPCPPGGIEPDSALIRSIGTSAAESVPRTMEAYVKLVPVPGGPLGEVAIFSEGDPEFNSNTQVFGGEAVEGNVYTNGDVILDSNATIYGDIDSQGSVLVNSNASVKRDITAVSFVHLNSNATVFRDVTSTGSSITLDSNAHIFEDARAATAITQGGGSLIDGVVIPNSPSPPPEYRSFPDMVFDPASWSEAGYQVQNFSSCLDAKTFMSGISSGNHVVRIASSCDLNYGSNETMTVRGNLAIVSDGSLTMNSNTQFVNSGDEHKLFLLFGLGASAPCNITFRSNSGIGADLKTILYTPCVIDLRSNTLVVEGQMFGGNVEFNSNASLTYEPIGVPGNGVTMYDEDIQYIREIVNQ